MSHHSRRLTAPSNFTPSPVKSSNDPKQKINRNRKAAEVDAFFQSCTTQTCIDNKSTSVVHAIGASRLGDLNSPAESRSGCCAAYAHAPLQHLMSWSIERTAWMIVAFSHYPIPIHTAQLSSCQRCVQPHKNHVPLSFTLLSSFPRPLPLTQPAARFHRTTPSPTCFPTTHHPQAPACHINATPTQARGAGTPGNTLQATTLPVLE